MRIAFFTETYPPYINGVATQTKMLKSTYASLGHEVLVVTVGSEKQKEKILKDGVLYLPGIELKKIYSYRISMPVSPSHLKEVADFNPDIIHVQNEFGVGLSGRKFAKKYNIPLVYTLHSEYDRFLFYVGLKDGNPLFEKISKKLSDQFLKKLPESADIITSPSYKAQAYLDRQKIDKKVYVIENTIDNSKFLPSPKKDQFRKDFREKYKLSDSTKALVFVGRIGKEKNIEELVESFIYANVDADKAKLFIIGKGPDLESITEMIKEKNLEDKIICLGPVDNTDIPLYLSAMDYYTTASLSEMHSISMLEGMASGLPALIKLDVPNESQIRKGLNGYTWEDKKDFKNLLDKVLNFSAEEEAKLKETTLAYIENNNNIKQAETLLALYEKAINKKNN